MIIIKLMTLLILLSSIFAQEFSEYDSNDNKLNENESLNGTDYEMDEEVDDERCSADSIIDQFNAMILPDDYEEGKSNVKDKMESFNETLKAINRLGEYQRNVSEKMSEFSKRLNSRVSEVLMTINLPPDCMKTLVRIMKAAQEGELWALKFLDAQPSMSMSVVDVSGPPYGNFDECLGIESPPEENEPVIRGKYCYVDGSFISKFDREEMSAMPMGRKSFDKLPHGAFNFYRQLTGKWFNTVISRNSSRDASMIMDFSEYLFPDDIKILGGICVPSTCDTEDLSRAMNELVYPITRLPVKLHRDCDYRGKPIKLDKYQWISAIILSSATMIALICSLVDIMPKNWIISKIIDSFVRNSFLENLITCFSIKRNFIALMSTKQYEKLKAFDGLRAFLSVWIVLMHTFETGFLVIHVRNYFLSSPYKMTKNYRNFFIPNLMIMDNFMFISAFFLCNTIMSKLEQNKGRFNYIQFIIFRYLRVLPIMVVGVAISFLFEFIGDGPFWTNIKLYIGHPCYDQWYKPLLMISNQFPYVNDNSTIISPLMCVNVSWYSSADFQLYIFSPIAFLVLYKSAKWGILWNLILLAIGMSVIPFTVYVLGVPHIWPSFVSEVSSDGQLSWQRHYWGSQAYIQTYIIGILVAFAVRRYPNLNFGGRIGELCVWVCALSSTLGVMWWQKDFIDFDYKYEGLFGYEAPVYYTFHKLLYLFGFSWLFYACATGRARLLNNIMGWKVFKIVDNVLIEIYVLHLFVVIYRAGTLREQVTYNDYYILTVTLFDFITTYIVSLLCALLLTRPFGELTMLLVRKPQTRAVPAKQEMTVDSGDLKIDISNDTKKTDLNNNGITDGINGITNQSLTVITTEVLDQKQVD